MVGAVVGESLRLYESRFARALLIAVVPLAPFELGVALFDPDYSDIAPSWWWWLTAGALIGLFVWPPVIALLIRDVSRADESFAAVARRTAARLGHLLLATAITTLAIVAAAVALIVPGLLLAARWTLVIPLIVLEDAGWRDAMSRSNMLVKGRTWSVAAVLALLFLIVLAISGATAVAVEILAPNVIGSWIDSLVLDAAALPLFGYASFVLYRRFTM